MLSKSYWVTGKKFTILLLLSITITFISYPPLLRAIDTGLDPSWSFALNYFFVKGMVLGKDVFFTYGPLGFLVCPLPLGNNLLIASIFWFLCRSILVFSLLVLAIQINREVRPIHQGIVAILILFFFCLLPNEMVLFFLSVTLLLLFNATGKQLFFFYAILISVLSFFIKPAFFVYSFSAIVTYLFIYSYINKNYKLVILTVGTFSSLYLIFWLIYSHSLVSAIDHLIVIKELIVNNTFAMSLNPENNWLYVGLSFIFIALTLMIYRRGRSILDVNGTVVSMIFILPIFAMFKYSYGREDNHITLMVLNLGLIFSYLAILLGRSNRPTASQLRYIPELAKFGFCALCAMGFQYLNQAYVGYKLLPAVTITGYKELVPALIHPAQTMKALEIASQSNLLIDKLPPNIVKRISNKTIDVYPWELSVIAANNFNWQPRPIIQSYIGYSPYLDGFNASYINDGKGPDFFLWYWNTPPYDLDERYILNSEPKTIRAILSWYDAIAINRKFVLFAKRLSKKTFNFQLVAQAETHWNEWIAVPNDAPTILLANIVTQTTWLEKIKLALYKLDMIWIDYQFSNGSIISHRLILANAVNGVWIKPYISFPLFREKFNIVENNDKIIAKSLATHSYIDTMSFAKDCLSLEGWAFIDNSIVKKQHVELLLQSSNKMYRVNTQQIKRSALLQAFPAYDPYVTQRAGFSSCIKLTDLPVGNYKVRVLVTSGNEKTFAQAEKDLKVTHDSSFNNVVAIRLRHGNFDFFKPEIKINWVGEKLAKPYNPFAVSKIRINSHYRSGGVAFSLLMRNK
ncbi:hypothetical protein BH10PSE19_BH10PSE19_08410 [soil metagenome]